MEKLNLFRLREYEVKSNNETKLGVIAQEVQLTNPKLVSEMKFLKEIENIDSKTGSISYAYEPYTKLGVELPNSWELVKAIQELDAKNKELEARIVALEKAVGTPPLGAVPQVQTKENWITRLIDWLMGLFK